MHCVECLSTIPPANDKKDEYKMADYFSCIYNCNVGIVNGSKSIAIKPDI